jgi:GNAT superfamily N-acetyltransferase
VELHHHDSGAALLERAGDFLRQHETVHSLLLVLAARPVEPGALAPYFVTVEDDHGISLVAIRRPPHNVVVSTVRERASAAFDLVVADLASRGHTLPGASGQADAALAFASRWAARSGTEARILLRFGAFELDRVVAPAWPPGELVHPAETEVDRLVGWANRFIDETGLPEEDRAMATHEAVLRRIKSGAIRAWAVDGAPVTMAVGTFGEIARVGAVYTPRELRRRGYASACVARLSEDLLARGARKVTLSADVKNPTSNKIYTALGYRRVGDEVMITFVPRGSIAPA